MALLMPFEADGDRYIVEYPCPSGLKGGATPPLIGRGGERATCYRRLNSCIAVQVFGKQGEEFIVRYHVDTG